MTIHSTNASHKTTPIYDCYSVLFVHFRYGMGWVRLTRGGSMSAFRYKYHIDTIFSKYRVIDID